MATTLGVLVATIDVFWTWQQTLVAREQVTTQFEG
jgi:hypothetical protein